jgi:hypothetical protein
LQAQNNFAAEAPSFKSVLLVADEASSTFCPAPYKEKPVGFATPSSSFDKYEVKPFTANPVLAGELI